MQHDASEQPHKQMQNKNHWKKPKNGGGKGKSLKIGGDWKPESLSTLVISKDLPIRFFVCTWITF